MRKILTEMTQKAEIYAKTRGGETVYHMKGRIFLHLKPNQITLEGHDGKHSFRFDYFNSVPADIARLIEEIICNCERQYKCQKSK